MVMVFVSVKDVGVELIHRALVLVRANDCLLLSKHVQTM